MAGIPLQEVQEQAITDDVVETAKNYSHIIGTTSDGQLQFDHQSGNTAILTLLNSLNDSVNTINERLNRIEVVIENDKIVMRNQCLLHLGPGQAYSLLRKENFGSGTALAQQIHGAALPPEAIVDPPAAIGDAPGSLNPFLATNNEILRLISYYNDAFGMVAGDNLELRRGKLNHWLTEHLR